MIIRIALASSAYSGTRTPSGPLRLTYSVSTDLQVHLPRVHSMSAVPTQKLPGGHQIPTVGLGTWKSQPGQVEEAVKAAIDLGYRHIDGAYGYGNEKEVGEAIKSKIEEGVVKREDLFVTSKLWFTRHSADWVRRSVQESLDNFGLDYLDMYLIHWPMSWKSGQEMFPRFEDGSLMYNDVPPMETWRELEKCVDDGLLKEIGLSNFNSEQIQDIVDNCRIKPANLQVEIHPYFSQEKLVKFAMERGLTVTAYSPLGSADRPWAAEGEPRLIDDPKLKALGEKYNKSFAQVILRWLTQRGLIIIPKSVSRSRIQENIALFDFTLSDEDMDLISSLNKNFRFVVPMATDANGKRYFRDAHAAHFPFNLDF